MRRMRDLSSLRSGPATATVAYVLQRVEYGTLSLYYHYYYYISVSLPMGGLSD